MTAILMMALALVTQQTANAPVPAEFENLDRPRPGDIMGVMSAFDFDPKAGWYRIILDRIPTNVQYREAFGVQPAGHFCTIGGHLFRYAEHGVRHEDRTLAPGWYQVDSPGTYVSPELEALQAQLQQGNQQADRPERNPLFVPEPTDPFGIRTAYRYERGQWTRRLLDKEPESFESRNVPGQPAGKFAVIDGELSRFAPGGIRHDGQPLGPGWYRTTDPGQYGPSPIGEGSPAPILPGSLSVPGAPR